MPGWIGAFPISKPHCIQESCTRPNSECSVSAEKDTVFRVRLRIYGLVHIVPDALAVFITNRLLLLRREF